MRIGGMKLVELRLVDGISGNKIRLRRVFTAPYKKL